MSDHDATRRRFLATGAGAAAVALAGCLGGGGDATGTESSMDGEMTDGSMDDDSMTDDSMTDDSMTEESMDVTWGVTVTNVSSGDTLETMDGSVAVPLSPGAYAVHTGMAHLFAPDEPASDGLESLAEDGDPSGLADAVADREGIVDSGAFTTPDGADGPAPLMPGESYTFEVSADPSADPKLSLATMFVQSNDLFYAPDPSGISLLADGEPVTGDVTGELALWDAGTEVNQPPGEGGDQAPRQDGPDTGEDEDGVVRPVDDEFEYPSTEEVIEVTLTQM
jgi:hypothetical protein